MGTFFSRASLIKGLERDGMRLIGFAVRCFKLSLMNYKSPFATFGTREKSMWKKLQQYVSQYNYLFSNSTSVPMARPLKTYSRKATLIEKKKKIIYIYQKENWCYEMRHCCSGGTPTWKCFAPDGTQNVQPSSFEHHPRLGTPHWYWVPHTDQLATSPARPAGSFASSSAVTALSQG